MPPPRRILWKLARGSPPLGPLGCWTGAKQKEPGGCKRKPAGAPKDANYEPAFHEKAHSVKATVVAALIGRFG
jgi:hypothetical protein